MDTPSDAGGDRTGLGHLTCSGGLHPRLQVPPGLHLALPCSCFHLPNQVHFVEREALPRSQGRSHRVASREAHFVTQGRFDVSCLGG